jgi:hypothetical protein
MTDALTMITMPALATIPNVELAETGQWDISTGRVTLTTEDFSNAVAALECPAIRKPIIKLGHSESMPDANKKRWDGEPSVGYINNMAVAESSTKIVGDYTGMPGWLGSIMGSAYPDRSMEATWDFQCQLGHIHPFVITAVALLGVTPPGIGTLESLNDVATLYGVAASSANPEQGVSVVIRATKGETPMPNPRPAREVAAGITTEDIRREYYDSAAMTSWIKEFEIDPLQLITIDEASGSHARVPVTLNGSDITFGDPIPVEIEYVDTPAKANASRIVYASREESRVVSPPVQVATDLPPVAAIHRVHQAAKTAEGKEGTMDPIKIRAALDLAPDASDDDVMAAIAARPAVPPTPPPAPVPTPIAAAGVPEGTVMLDSSIVKRLQEDAAKGVQAMAEIQKNKRDTVIAAAIRDAKFPPARREHYELMWDGDPIGTEQHINRLAAGMVPLVAAGYQGTETFEDDARYFGLYPEDAPNKDGVR